MTLARCLPVPYCLLFLLCISLRLGAQLTPINLAVFDSTQTEVGPVVDLGSGTDHAIVGTSLGGHVLLLVATYSDLGVLGGGDRVFFASPNCTGQAYISASITTPRFYEPHTVAGPSRQVFIGSRVDPTQPVTYNSFMAQHAACTNSPGSWHGVVPATLIGQLPAFTPPFSLGPASAPASASVPALSPLGIGSLVLLLGLAGIMFLLRRPVTGAM